MWETLTTSEELRLEVHVIEGVDGLIVVGLDLSCKACVVSKSVDDMSGLLSSHESAQELKRIVKPMAA